MWCLCVAKRWPAPVCVSAFVCLEAAFHARYACDPGVEIASRATFKLGAAIEVLLLPKLTAAWALWRANVAWMDALEQERRLVAGGLQKDHERQLVEQIP